MVLLTEVLAAGSASSSFAHNQNPTYGYDVFISFRGADTRNGFTDHLYNALLGAGFDTFLDDEEIETGEPLKPELKSAIKSSRASVIVLSKNYASSTWCLDELVLILEQQRSFRQIVIPIFYDVEPTDVRKQQSSFMEAMAKHKQRMDAETDAEKRSQLAQKMELWKKALTEVADLKGKDAKGRKETEFIEEVVTDIHRRLGAPLSNTLPLLIGMDYEIKFISSWLADGSGHTADILTVFGMSGIGKTSLAQYVFQLHSCKFQKSSFIEGVNARCNERFNGLLKLQRQLHGDISKSSPLQVNVVSVYTSKIEKALACNRVFIVLDDIDSLDQLNALLGNKGLHPGSKIIITTQDPTLTERCALFKSQVHPKHKKVSLNGLYEWESLKLLCIHAFESQKPKEGYEDVSKVLAKYCEGHPLALEILGGCLQKRDVAYWKGFIEGLKKEPLSGLEKAKKALHMSLESLSSENDKELFKHIACFFVGKDIDLTETILESCGINTKCGITNLMDRCFLIRGSNILKMHSLVQEMGRYLVRQESPNRPAERSRLWCDEESFDVLKRKKGTKYLLGLALDMRTLDKKKLRGSLELKKESFCQMDNLMLLKLNYVQLDECFQFPEELRWLCMNGFPLKSISIDQPMEYLVALDMSYSRIESFDMSYRNPQPPAKRQKQLIGSCSKQKRLFESLKILDLSFCEHLHSVGGFYELPTLERLIVRNCISLMEVCESIEQCVELVHIDLGYCYKLKKLPTSLGNLKKVKTLLLDGCNCQASPSDIMEAIPTYLNFLTISLPRSLVCLSLEGNNLCNESFPVDWSCLAKLEELYLSFNPIVSMPGCVRTLPRLKILEMSYCDLLISIEHPPRTLRHLSFFKDHGQAIVRKIKFNPEMSPLKLEGIGNVPSWSLLEIDGVMKVQAMACVEENVLRSLGWRNLDFINERCFKIPNGFFKESQITQIWYAFGIFSTFYEGDSMPNWISWRSDGPSISFTIPFTPYKLRGLNFCCVEESSALHRSFHLPRIKISNITEKKTWIYQHSILRVKPDGEYFSLLGHLIWLSHWMFGPNEMRGGDHITIEVQHEKRRYIQHTLECGVGLVYDEDGKTEEDEEDALGYYKSWSHIIGGDLSPFQLTTGEYYLNTFCRFVRPPIGIFCDFTDEEIIYKDEIMDSFKAFSKKKSEILVSQAQCSETRPTAMAPAGAPCMPIVPLMQQQMVPYGLMPHYPPDHSNIGDVSMGSVPYDVGKVMQLTYAGGISALANAFPTEQRTMLGENLYPLVESEAKVTADFLRLMESPEALKATVEEAMEVEQADELASLLSL